jgi:hypothetical protein
MSSIRNCTVPHYFKSDFPDQRFLPFRLFLHNRKAQDAVPDFQFFESYYTGLSKSKPRLKKLSPIRSNKAFESRERLYCELFTNGRVDIRSDVQLALGKSKSKSPIPEKFRHKLERLKRRTQSRPKKKKPADMIVDKEKKEKLISSRILGKAGKG